MKMFYRGAQYEAHLPQVESDAVETIGMYRGAPMLRKHFNVNQPNRHEQMIYRGVKYTH